MQKYDGWDGAWKVDGKEWWSWTWIHNEERLDITFAELQELVKDETVDRITHKPYGKKEFFLE